MTGTVTKEYVPFQPVSTVVQHKTDTPSLLRGHNRLLQEEDAHNWKAVGSSRPSHHPASFICSQCAKLEMSNTGQWERL